MTDIEEQNEDVRGRGRGDSYHRGGDNSRSLRRIIEAVVIAAIIGLGSVVWLLKGTVEVQQVSIQFLQKQQDATQAETRDNSHKIDEMQGRFYRGMSQGKDIYAPDPK